MEEVTPITDHKMARFLNRAAGWNWGYDHKDSETIMFFDRETLEQVAVMTYDNPHSVVIGLEISPKHLHIYRGLK